MSSVMGTAPGSTITPSEAIPPDPDALDPEVFDYFTALDAAVVTGSPAVATVRNSHPLVVFPYSVLAPVTSNVDFHGVRYVWNTPASGNILVRLLWASTVLVGDVEWSVAIERDNALGVDLDVNNFAAAKTVVSTAAPVSGQLREAQITFSPAEFDGVLAGEAYRMRVTRTAGAGLDTMLADAQLFRVILGATL